MKAYFFIQLSEVMVGLHLSLLKGGMLLNLLLGRRHLIGGSTSRIIMSNKGHHKQGKGASVHPRTVRIKDMSKVVEDRGR